MGGVDENMSTKTILVKNILTTLKGLTKMFPNKTVFPNTPKSFSEYRSTLG
jgi:hypothetical protein